MREMIARSDYSQANNVVGTLEARQTVDKPPQCPIVYISIDMKFTRIDYGYLPLYGGYYYYRLQGLTYRLDKGSFAVEQR